MVSEVCIHRGRRAWWSRAAPIMVTRKQERDTGRARASENTPMTYFLQPDPISYLSPPPNNRAIF
jgi:hypothetical protein